MHEGWAERCTRGGLRGVQSTRGGLRGVQSTRGGLRGVQSTRQSQVWYCLGPRPKCNTIVHKTCRTLNGLLQCIQITFPVLNKIMEVKAHIGTSSHTIRNALFIKASL